MIYTVSIKNDQDGYPVVVVYVGYLETPIREIWVASICTADRLQRPRIVCPPEVWGPREYRETQRAIASAISGIYEP